MGKLALGVAGTHINSFIAPDGIYTHDLNFQEQISLAQVSVQQTSLEQLDQYTGEYAESLLLYAGDQQNNAEGYSDSIQLKHEHIADKAELVSTQKAAFLASHGAAKQAVSDAEANRGSLEELERQLDIAKNSKSDSQSQLSGAESALKQIKDMQTIDIGGILQSLEN